MHRVLILASPVRGDVGRTVALGVAPLRIGREEGASNALVLDDPEASREHAVVEPAEGAGYRIRDLDSRNGTFVGGQPVTPEAELHNGDVIRIGSHLLLFQYLTLKACQELPAAQKGDPVLVGRSVAIHEVRREIRTFAHSAAPVLVLGETGVGKELVAREVHARSERRGPFVPVNCAALPEALVESELFGHARGAFTGATEASGGLFGAAEGGTLFLDEIGAMPIGLQPKLLRALADGEVRGVGESRTRKVDVRLVAATNEDVEAAVEASTFRADLYARLMGVCIRVPPLRDRREDVIELLGHFLAAAGFEGEPTVDAAEALLVHRWPFNVRELEQVARAAAAAATAAGEDRLDLPHLPPAMRAPIEARSGGGSAEAGSVPIELRIRRDAIPSAEELAEVLRHFEGNVVKAAEFFGRDRRQLYRWARRHGLDPSTFRGDEPER